MFPLRERRRSATARNSHSSGLEKQEDSPEIGSKKVGNFLNSLKKEVNYTNYASHDKSQVS
jgi:hypothetical protein